MECLLVRVLLVLALLLLEGSVAWKAVHRPLARVDVTLHMMVKTVVDTTTTDVDAFMHVLPWYRSLVKDQTAVLLVDGDNLRGKTKFVCSKEDICRSIYHWLEHRGLVQQAIVMFDHGKQASAHHFLPEDTKTSSREGLLVAFSGPSMSVDQMMQRDIAFLQSTFHQDVVVVTEDMLLRKKCKTQSEDHRKNVRKAGKKDLLESAAQSLHVISSPRFIELLQYSHPVTPPFHDNINQMDANTIQQDMSRRMDLWVKAQRLLNTLKGKQRTANSNRQTDQRLVEKLKLLQRGWISQRNHTVAVEAVDETAGQLWGLDQFYDSLLEDVALFEQVRQQRLLTLLQPATGINRTYQPEEAWERMIEAEVWRSRLQAAEEVTPSAHLLQKYQSYYNKRGLH